MANIYTKKVVNVDLTGCEVEALKTTMAVIRELHSCVQAECYSNLVTLTGFAFDESQLEDTLEIITTLLEESEFEVEE